MIQTMLQCLEDTWLAGEIRQSIWLYPGLEIVHIIGITLLVGPAFMLDLRLLGLSKNLPVAELAHHLLSWSERGLILIVPSGILLFITNAVATGNNPVFWLKMFLLVVGILNALVFRRFTIRSVTTWNLNATSPTAAKISAFVSIIVWIIVIACGRLLAY